eukprot:6193631-Pleurochrysis_carterae.AAC.1
MDRNNLPAAQALPALFSCAASPRLPSRPCILSCLSSAALVDATVPNDDRSLRRSGGTAETTKAITTNYTTNNRGVIALVNAHLDLNYLRKNGTELNAAVAGGAPRWSFVASDIYGPMNKFDVPAEGKS